MANRSLQSGVYTVQEVTDALKLDGVENRELVPEVVEIGLWLVGKIEEKVKANTEQEQKCLPIFVICFLFFLSFFLVIAACPQSYDADGCPKFC